LSASIAFSYAYSPDIRGRASLESLPNILGADDIAKITYRNAEHLLSLHPTA
jgi:hypothetical protein